METESRKSHYLKRLHHNFEWMLLITLLAFLISSTYTFFVKTPIYESSTEVLIVNSSNETEEITDSLSLSMVTYSYILTNDNLLEDVIEDLSLEIRPSSLRDQVIVEQVENSEILIIKVEDENPYRASEIANTITGNFEEIFEQTTNGEAIQILTSAVPSDKPSHPNYLLNIFIGTLIGFIFSLVVVLNQREETGPEAITPQIAEDLTGVKNLGKISSFIEDDYMILKIRPRKKKDHLKEKEQIDEETLSRMNRHRL